MSDSGGLDARSLQDMRQRAERFGRDLAAYGADGIGEADAERLVRDVLVLLDERQRLVRLLKATPLDDSPEAQQ